MKYVVLCLMLLTGLNVFAAEKENRVPASSEFKKGDYLCVGADSKNRFFVNPSDAIPAMNELCDRDKPFQMVRDSSGGGRSWFNFCCVRK